MTTGPRSTFTTILARIKAGAEYKVSGAVNMTVDNQVVFLISLSDVETAGTTWSIVDTGRIPNQPQRDIYCITSKDQMRFKKELSICLVEFKIWWQAVGIQVLGKTI
jgi:hypothetical protein